MNLLSATLANCIFLEDPVFLTASPCISYRITGTAGGKPGLSEPAGSIVEICARYASSAEAHSAQQEF